MSSKTKLLIERLRDRPLVIAQPLDLKTPQYWLVELSQHGNPTLVDGAHDSPAGANKAAYLIQAMRLGKPGRKFAVAKIELSECVPSADGVNQEAVRTINAMRARGEEPTE